MKKIVLALTAVAAFAGSAVAADLPARPYTKAAPLVAAAPSWTGCYVGGGIGYGLWNQENTLYDDPTSVSGRRIQASATETSGGRGWLGRAQVGCDYQFAAMGMNWIVGAFGDYDWSSLKGNVYIPAGSFVGSEKQTSAWGAGGRIGWVVFPQLMTFVSGGYTQANFDGVNFRLDPFQNPNVFNSGLNMGSKNYNGWFLGGGDEYAISMLPGLFWKTEYRLSEYKRQTNPLLNVNTTLGPTFESIDSKKWVQTITSELVYRFNWGGPVVAKY